MKTFKQFIQSEAGVPGMPILPGHQPATQSHQSTILWMDQQIQALIDNGQVTELKNDQVLITKDQLRDIGLTGHSAQLQRILQTQGVFLIDPTSNTGRQSGTQSGVTLKGGATVPFPQGSYVINRSKLKQLAQTHQSTGIKDIAMKA